MALFLIHFQSYQTSERKAALKLLKKVTKAIFLRNERPLETLKFHFLAGVWRAVDASGFCKIPLFNKEFFRSFFPKQYTRRRTRRQEAVKINDFELLKAQRDAFTVQEMSPLCNHLLNAAEVCRGSSKFFPPIYLNQIPPQFHQLL